MSVAAALLSHLIGFITGLALVWQPTLATPEWLAWYCIGASAIAVTHWIPASALRLSVALQVSGFSLLIAAWLWGANYALDQLGNSVPVRHVGASPQAGLPLHFVLFPAVFAFGVGSWVHALLRRRVITSRTIQPKAGGA